MFLIRCRKVLLAAAVLAELLFAVFQLFHLFRLTPAEPQGSNFSCCWQIPGNTMRASVLGDPALENLLAPQHCA